MFFFNALHINKTCSLIFILLSLLFFMFSVFLSVHSFPLHSRFLLPLYLLCQSKSRGACQNNVRTVKRENMPVVIGIFCFLIFTLYILYTTCLTHRSSFLSSPDGDENRSPTPFQRNVGVQTDYRESETQTDPYTPDYVLRPGTAPPELLTLATLTWGKQI